LSESTGKEGTGLISVAEEPIVSGSAYARDRFFVYLRLAGDRIRQLDQQVASLAGQGQPVLTLDLRDLYDLGSEFFRWEFATAIAGHLLGIQPFDQPNVQESEDNTNRVLDRLQTTGRLPKQSMATFKQVTEKLKRRCRPGTYVAILAYATPSAKIERAIRSLRKTLVTHYRVSTTAGYGPRYLHSTVQLHKGGPNSGCFLQLVEPLHPDLEIPGRSFTFGTLAQAQAIGDVEALHAHQREVITVSLGNNPATTLTTLTKSLAPARPIDHSTSLRRTRTHSRKK
jgi:glucose-6-phosphate isomerase